MMGNFIEEEGGAVTVDWVVLTAALVGLGLAVMTVVGDGINDAANATADSLADDETIMAAASLRRSFDVGEYVPLTGDTNFGSIQTATTGQTEGQLRAWGSLAESIANDTNQTLAVRQQEADTYAARYAELQTRGLDVSGMTDPRDLAASIE